MSLNHLSNSTTTLRRSGIAEGLLAWGVGLTVTLGFYVVLPFLPIDQSLAYRYFCSHWITYTTTALFFVGMAILAQKASRIPRERAALQETALSDFHNREFDSDHAAVDWLQERLNLVSKRLNQTQWLERVRGTCRYVRSKRSASGLEGHLGYLADVAATRLHDSYASVRTITWAIPILGFLGTVIGITMAIANITPDQLESSLNEVTGGLAVAFDTTALSLGLSMVLVFATFGVERSEQTVLDEIEDLGLGTLLGLFPESRLASSPLLAAETEAARTITAQTAILLERHVELWNESLAGLREQWTATLAKQQTTFDVSMSQAWQSTLAHHEQGLVSVREEFLIACKNFGFAMQQHMEQWSQTSERSLVEQREREGAFWKASSETWASRQQDAAVIWRDVAREFADSLAGWNDRLNAAQDLAAQQLTALNGQQATWLKLVNDVEGLSRVESRLASNLDTLRVADTLESTMENLNAAITLLSLKARGVKAA